MYPQDEIDDREDIAENGLFEDDPEMCLCLQCIFCPVNDQKTQPFDGSWQCLKTKKWRWATDIWEHLCPYFTQKKCENCKFQDVCYRAKAGFNGFCTRHYQNRGIKNPYHYIVGLQHLYKRIRVDRLVQANQLKYQRRHEQIQAQAQESIRAEDLDNFDERRHTGTEADSPTRYDEMLQSVFQSASLPDTDTGDSNTHKQRDAEN